MKRAFSAALLSCLLTLGAFAATFSGTLTSTSGAASIGWNGGPLTGTLGYTGLVGLSPPCTAQVCDFYNLTLNIPSTYYSTNPSFAVHVTLNWGTVLQELDVYVFDANGNLVGASTNGSVPNQDADCGPLPAGNYTIEVVPASSVAENYAGAISLQQEPAMPTGKARYRTGNFTFTAQQLTRPASVEASTTLFGDSDVEPRVVHDPVGNIYVAAIQGVPTGTDMWKSADGGNTFIYMGQPDGAQAASAVGPNGVGVGGGDEDISVGSSGNLYLSSLWLGAVTECNSSNGAVTWLCNPVANDLPEDDRQWVAGYGQNIVYLTTKQLGTLSNGTLTIYVVKSFDGGNTFPQVVEVTQPIFGVQPGVQGNILVDQNNGNVYNVFISSSGNQVYLAKSTDGGQTWMLKLIYQAGSGISLANVFPALALDKAGNLYVVFNDGSTTFLTSSKDQGLDWTTPVKVNTGSNDHTSLEPWITAGDAGKVDIFFYGTSAASFTSSNAQWQVFMAQTQNALANVPTFYIQAATNVMHVGEICVNGTACPSGTRNLAEYFYPDTYPDGNALATYPDDVHVVSPPVVGAWFLKQTGGTRIIGSN